MLLSQVLWSADDVLKVFSGVAATTIVVILPGLVLFYKQIHNIRSDIKLGTDLTHDQNKELGEIKGRVNGVTDKIIDELKEKHKIEFEKQELSSKKERHDLMGQIANLKYQIGLLTPIPHEPSPTEKKDGTNS